MVLRDLLGPTDLKRTETFCIYKLAEIIIVSKNKDLIFVAFKIVASSLKDLKNSQNFLIAGFVSCLNQNHLLQEISYGVALTRFWN